MGYQRRVHGDSCPVSTERQQYSSKMKFLALSVILALAVTLSSAVSVEQALHQEWELFKSTHGKSYSESENEFRIRVFLDNRDKVAAHNALFAKGEVTFTLAMNKFGDLLSQEFAALFNGYSSQPRSGAVFMKPENFKAPSRIKNNADPAGHSQLLVLWKDSISASLVNWSPRANKIWLTAAADTATLDATADSWTLLSNTL